MLTLSLLLASPAPATAKIVSASLFKNGFAMVRREIAVNSGGVSLTEIPQAALGTFWVASTRNVKVKELISTQEEIKSTYQAGSLDQLLALNLGKNLKLTTVNLGVVSGTLMSIHGEHLLVSTAEGTIAMPRGEIRLVSFAEKVTTGGETKSLRRALNFKTEGEGKLILFGLERGLSWTPGYAIDISDKKTLNLTAKATVSNDLGELSNVELRFVTGVPNVPWASIIEPLLSPQSVDTFTNMLKSVGEADANFNRRDMRGQSFGNQAPADFAGAFDPSQAGGEQNEDLFFYKQPNVSLKVADRALYILFESKSEYEHLYTCDVPDTVVNNRQYVGLPEGPTDVWHKLKFKNKAGQPLTTGPATIYQNNQVMGQDTLNYTAAGADSTLKMSKAMDVRVDATEEEVDRKRDHLKLRNGTYYDLVTIKGTVQIQNMKPAEVELQLSKAITGEFLGGTDGAKATKTAKGLREENPRTNVKWTLPLGSGKKAEVTYSYSVFVSG